MITTLECPLCGCDAATSDSLGYFEDGQPIVCGCVGHVSVAVDEGDAYVSVDEDATVTRGVVGS